MMILDQKCYRMEFGGIVGRGDVLRSTGHDGVKENSKYVLVSPRSDNTNI